jgi:hypothetical protein
MRMEKKAAVEAVPLPVEPEGYGIRWSGLALTFDEATLNALVARLVDRIPDLKDLRLEITNGELHRFGVPLSAKATLTQLRLKDGFIAFLLDKVQALSFIPIPDQLLSYLVQKAPPGLLTYYPADRILVLNLNDWMPPGMDLSLERTVFGERSMTMHFGSGSYDLTDLLGEPSPDDE